jgi:carboxymethylenebutenolidase
MPAITIQATDGSGSFSAYLVEPAKKPAGVVVLIQEIFGVNQAMRDIAAWVADIGFIAVCPDLFWRIEPGVDITDKSEAEWKQAFELFNKFDQAKGIEDLKAPSPPRAGSPAPMARSPPWATVSAAASRS